MQQLAQTFVDRTAGWRDRLEEDEWFFANLREEMVGNLQPFVAFDALGPFGSIFLQLGPSYLQTEAAYFLVALARQTNTTEMPASLAAIWTPIVSTLASSSPSALLDLSQWYRVDAP